MLDSDGLGPNEARSHLVRRKIGGDVERFVCRALEQYIAHRTAYDERLVPSLPNAVHGIEERSRPGVGGQPRARARRESVLSATRGLHEWALLERVRKGGVRFMISKGLLMLTLLMLCTSSAQADPAAALPAPRIRAWQTGLLAPDRLQHGSLSLTLGLGAGMAGARPAAVLIGTSVLGLAKEFHDGRQTRFDPIDFAADVCGAGVATLLVRKFTH